jgi:hypothetical protein
MVGGDRALTRGERRRRRQHRRLIPLVASLAMIAAAAWLFLGPRSDSSANGTTSSTVTSSTTTTTVPLDKPPTITLAVTPAQTNEGRWIPRDMWHSGVPLIFSSHFRLNVNDPSIVAYVTWIRSSSTRLGLYLGYEGPGPSSLSRGPEMVPLTGRSNLLATFNSGFYEKDSAEGFFTHNRLYFPMKKGHATLVEYTNGTIDIVNWTGPARPGLNVLMARQNLHLLLNDAKVSPATAIGANWGVTLHGVPAVWRTAVGVDAHGNLMYLAAPSQTAASLARALQRVGAVRAMQLDINPEWPIFVTYTHAGAGGPRLFVPNPNQVANRFLYTSTKDFFAVYVRVPGQLQTPW